MEETPRALRAFEDYYNSGATRSLRKLAELYRARSAEGEEVPTRHFETLAQWSRAHNWQARVKKRAQEDAAQVRAVIQERAIRLRERLCIAVEVDINRYLQRICADPDEMMAKDARSLETLVRLFFELAEQPLGSKFQVEMNATVSTTSLMEQIGRDPEATELVGKLSERIACSPEGDLHLSLPARRL
jgi:hypothetical protein